MLRLVCLARMKKGDVVRPLAFLETRVIRSVDSTSTVHDKISLSDSLTGNNACPMRSDNANWKIGVDSIFT
jgi:hypothetical protein